MKIVFVQPKTNFGNTWEALNIGYLASYLKEHLFGGSLDMEFYSGFFDNDKEIIDAGNKADVTAFSVTSPQFKHANYLASKIKGCVVFGGVHPSALPNDMLATGNVSVCVVGEGEKAFHCVVAGSNDRIIKQPYIEDLDTIPFPDRKLIKQERNIAVAYKDNGVRIGSLITSRGCPYHCVFCASHCVWGRKVRFRSAENILEEFKQIVKDLKLDFVKFSDDTFGLNREIALEFCERKININDKTPWGCNVRVDNLDNYLLFKMGWAGCEELWMGVESGSPMILRDMKKGITVEQIREAFRIANDFGFKRRAYCLLGMPNETLADIRMTESLIDEIEPDSVGFTILAPYPGTEFYDEKTHREVDWSEVDEYSNSLTNTKYLTNKELQEEQKRLVKKYQEKITFRQKEKNGKES